MTDQDLDRLEANCDVYWGSHGCHRPRGHQGPHLCDCALPNWRDYLPDGYQDDGGVWNVGAPPYYGQDTNFYGDHVAELDLPPHGASAEHRRRWWDSLQAMLALPESDAEPVRRP